MGWGGGDKVEGRGVLGKGVSVVPSLGFTHSQGALSGRQSDLCLSPPKVTPQSPGTPCSLLGGRRRLEAPFPGDSASVWGREALRSAGSSDVCEDTSDAASGHPVLRARWLLP